MSIGTCTHSPDAGLTWPAGDAGRCWCLLCLDGRFHGSLAAQLQLRLGSSLSSPGFYGFLQVCKRKLLLPWIANATMCFIPTVAAPDGHALPTPLHEHVHEPIGQCTQQQESRNGSRHPRRRVDAVAFQLWRQHES